MPYEDVLFETSDGGGWVTLNRPQALNSLTVDMVKAIKEMLLKWEGDLEVSYVVIQGEGRSFCAGGDLRKLYDAAKSGQDAGAIEFFKHEYDLNLLIHNYSKPYIALLHGITMGGGMGLSIHGTYRIVTQNTLMAMPETAIGLFPDVGAAWFLNRCPGKSGLYVALTSARFNHADALYMGLATHHVEDLPGLVTDIKLSRGNNIKKILEKWHLPPVGTSEIQTQQSLIDGYFDKNSLEDIFRALAASDSDFAVQTLGVLKQRSPLSLRTTFDYFKQAETMTIEQVMARDFDLASSWIQEEDLHEGIRATLIDKDQKPLWKSKPITH